MARGLACLVAAGAFAGCGGDPPAPAAGGDAVWAVDDTGDTLRLARPATRVLSLLPAGTETFFALGAGDLVVGRTRYDTDPHLQRLPSVGGGLDPSIEAIVALRPELVVTWEPAGGGSRVAERLRAVGIAVFAIQTRDTSDIFRNIESLGRLTGRDGAADRLAAGIRAELDSVRARVRPGPRPSVLFVVSLDPPMTAGTGNFLAELMEVSGGRPLDIAGHAPGLSPVVSIEELVRRDPDVILLPVGAAHTTSARRLLRLPGWREIRAVHEGRVAEVPADLVNRPGPRIAEMAEALRVAIESATHAPTESDR